MKIRCFVDVDGHIWSIDHNGKSNFPGEIQIKTDEVWVLGADDGEGQSIDEEYTLWPSLTALAVALEQNPPQSVDGSISLDQAVAEAHVKAESFKSNWLRNNKLSPDRYPLAFPKEDSGLWFEQMAEES
jgi:hypothetical protein